MIKSGHIFKSKEKDISLILREMEEPNYGRLRFSFDFMINGDRVIDSNVNEYSRLILNLERFQFESETGRYFLIPLESGFLIYDSSNLDYIKSPKPSVAPNNQFINNYFTNSYLVINRQREIIIFDLEKEHAINVSFPFGKYTIIDSKFTNDQRLMINYKDLNDYNIYDREYSFNEQRLL